MDKIIKALNERVVVLKNSIAKAKRDDGTFPEGNLRLSVSYGHKRYYHVTQNGDVLGKYIKKDQMYLASSLAQKDYNRRFLKNAQYELDMIKKIIRQLEVNNADKAYDDLSDYRKILVTPYIMPDILYAEEWQSKQFKPNSYMPEMKLYDTNRGEKVRSKSEAILADILYELKIPYHYEKPLYLGPGKVRYPDFTLLNIRSREEIYFEHFGLLDDDKYLDNCLLKLDEYRKNSIYIGKNLIFTYETGNSPLDIKGIKKMLKEILLSE